MLTKPAPVMDRLNLWWILAAGCVIALIFGATDHIWRCWGTLSVTLVVCAIVRLLARDETAGGLVVRRKWVDVTTLLLLALAIAVVGTQLDLTSLVAR